MNTHRRKTNDVLRGTLCILASAFFFALMSMFVRLAGELPAMQKAFFRNLVAAFTSALVLARSGERFSIPKGSLFPLFMRGFLGTIGLICNYWVLGKIGIADANMLLKLSPFFTILFSAYLLGEKPGKADILCVCAAFLGTVFVVRPSAGIASLPSLVGVLAAFCAGVAYSYVRKLGTMGVKGATVVAFFSFFSCLVCLPSLVFRYHPMTVGQWAYLLLAGCSAACAQFSITAAYRYAPARDISVFEYSQVPWAALLGIVFLREIPEVSSLIGYVIIISAAVLRFCVQRKKSA